MSSSGNVLTVKPAYRSVPPPASTSGQEAVELAASAGLVLDPWQADVVCDLLGEDADGFWAATSGGLVCPRQNGKGSVIEALELAWLFLCDVELIFHSAHLFATASDAFRRIKFLIQNTPDLHRQVLRYSEAHGQEGIELRSGQRLRFVARSKSGGRGFPAPVVVLDEAFNLTQQAVAALVPTMSAQPNPFLLLTSSAPIPDECSDVLRGFMRDSREGVARRVYIEYSADRAEDDDTQVRSANPGYGIRLNDDVIDEERRMLTPDLFRIERLGIVDLATGQGFREITSEDWTACLDVKSGPLDPVSFALDVAEDRSWSAIGIAARSGRGGTHVELSGDHEQYDYRPGTDWVVPRAKQIYATWQRPFAVVKGSPAWSLEADLRAAGVPIREVTGQEFAQGCGQIYDAAVQHSLKHLGQPALTAAVANVAKKKSGDAFVWDRRNSAADISPFVAVTVAKYVADQNEQPVDVADNIW